MSSRNVSVKWLLNPAANPSKTSGVNYTAYTSVAWSPSGCDSYGRCIIATLCLDYRFSLYTSNKIHKKWKEIFCISDKWLDKCKPFIESDSKFNKMKKRKKLPQNWISKQDTIAMSNLEMNFVDIVAFTAIDWCPVLIDIGNKDSTATLTSSQKYALLAAATKNGNITFWKVAVPLPYSGAEVQFVEGNIQTDVQLPCSIAWFSSNACEGLIAVGGSNGQIEVFVIKVSRDPETSMTVKSTSKHMLWKDCDNLAVNRLCWSYSRKRRSFFATLSASKGSSVLQFSVPYLEDENLQGLRHCIYDGLHSVFITGMGVSQNGKVVTCDSDGALQMIDDSPKEIRSEYYSSYSCNGVAVSPNGLYIALLHTPNIARLQINKWENRHIQISFLSLFSEEVLSGIVTETSLGSLWDIQTSICQYYSQNVPRKEGAVMEFLTRPLDSIPFFFLYVRHRLVDQLAKSSDSESFTLEDVEGETNVIRKWKLETSETGRHIVKICLTASLELFLKNCKESELTEKARTSLLIMSDWLVMNYNDEDSLDLAVRVYTDTGDTKSAGLALSIRAKMLENVEGMLAGDPLKQERVEKKDLNQNGFSPNKSQDVALKLEENELPCREKCVICQERIPLTCFTTGECANGHKWKRCLATICVCSDYLYQRCQDCGGCISLIGQEQSPWLQKLLRETQFCSLCHGWKD